MARFKVELNDIQNIRDLLQNAYNIADEQIVQSQNEIAKLASATNLHEEPMDAKAKYAKAINDYLGIKDKAISKKLDIAKLLTEILHHNGDVKGAIESGGSSKNTEFNFEEIRQIVDNSLKKKKKTKTIQLNNK